MHDQRQFVDHVKLEVVVGTARSSHGAHPVLPTMTVLPCWLSKRSRIGVAYFPGAQSRHTVLPALSAYLWTHKSHAVWAARSEKLPVGHVVQRDVSWARAYPAGHSAHADGACGGVGCLPMGHDMHTLDLAVCVYCVGPHLKHPGRSGKFAQPKPHGSHSFFWLGVVALGCMPTGHAWHLLSFDSNVV